ncbi:MAG: DUF4080 domain-containing protein [Proteobacteria bacterium]|nr:DUF4080 domain-containing protein [Pseudomonadota bacterium]
MADIVLATANARFSHTSLALRCLKANLGPLKDRSAIMEFTIDERPGDIAEKILEAKPKILGLGVYIWNVTMLTETVELIKQVQPELTLVLGGPEVGFDTQGLKIVDRADYVIAGEGEAAFSQLSTDLLESSPPGDKLIPGGLPDLASLALPYDLYEDPDIANRVIYVEASRGCPFSCEFCLSSLDKKVRKLPLDRLIKALEKLWNRGARRFKFVDRALHLAVTPDLLEFFLDRLEPDLFLHFELIPDHLPEKLFNLFTRFPPGAVQLEAGVQTANPLVASRIGRKQNSEKVFNTLCRLRSETGVHIHSDLVVGLPGETLESFAQGFDRLTAARPHEIQVGILKGLRGAPIRRHDIEWDMIYNPSPPYDILKNRHMDFATMQRLKRFSRYFDLVYNSGNFVSSTPLIWGDSSPFNAFYNFSDWLYKETKRTSAIALNRLSELLFTYITTVLGRDKSDAANRLFADYARLGRKSLPGAIRAHVTEPTPSVESGGSQSLPLRQKRHAAINRTR